MLVRSPNGTYETIDFREKAPLLANATMYVQNVNLSLYGGLAVGVPGELAGSHFALCKCRILDIAPKAWQVTVEYIISTGDQISE
jgi:gamma-glutamyltranspeptidase